MDGGLVGGLDDDLVDVHVCRARGHPDEGLGDVLGGERLDTAVHGVGTDLIALESDEGELAEGHARVQGRNPDAGAVEFQSERLGDAPFRGLHPAIGRAPFVGAVAGDGADVDETGSGVSGHEGYDRAGDPEQAEEIGLNHGFPIRVLSVHHRFESMGTARVVDQDVDVACPVADGGGEFPNGLGGTDVERQGMGFPTHIATGLGHPLQAIETSCTDDETGAGPGKGHGRGGTESARGAGDEHPTMPEIHDWILTLEPWNGSQRIPETSLPLVASATAPEASSTEHLETSDNESIKTPEMSESTTDLEIVRAVLKGETSRFEEIVTRYQARLFGMARRYSRREDEVADVVQEIFLKAYARLDSWRGDAPFEHWLMRLATNTCYDFLRGHQRNREDSFTDLTREECDWLERNVAGTHRDSSSADAAKALVAKVLERLSPANRMVITLLELEDRPVREIAALTGWSESLVKVRAFRARAEMRRILGQMQTDSYL